MKLEILCVGTELLNGAKSDAHTAYLGLELAPLGLRPSRSSCVGDDAAEIRQAMLDALGRCELLIVCGGLGPTLDDISRDVAAALAGRPLKEDPALAAHLRGLFASRGREMPENNLRQAQVPEGAAVLANPAGTAPGLFMECLGGLAGKCMALLPGPPRELKAVFEGALLPLLKERFKAPAQLSRRIFCWGLAESAVDELVKDLVPQGDTLSLALLAHEGYVEVRLNAAEESLLAEREAKALSRLGDHAFSSEGKLLEEVVAELLLQAKATVATAESCTGGRVAAKLTSVPGSSGYFNCGFITYSDESKMKLLEVPPFVLKKAGAVSKDTALAMAVGLARKAGCDYALSVTGIAGPAGGSPEKPVGTVHYGLATPDGVFHQKQFFGSGQRAQIQARAAQAGLFLLYCALAGIAITEEGTDRATLPGNPPSA